jgi:hypothetical protein
VALGNAATGYHLPLPWELGRQAGSAGTLTFSISIGVIATYLFWLRGRLAATQARAEAAQRLAAETQLKLMESQLEPHMLFNTLANLRALIGVDPAQAQAMLDRLIDFLRGTLQATRVERHALSVEFARLADYLALMQVRMGDRLACTLDCRPSWPSCPCPAAAAAPGGKRHQARAGAPARPRPADGGPGGPMASCTCRCATPAAAWPPPDAMARPRRAPASAPSRCASACRPCSAGAPAS